MLKSASHQHRSLNSTPVILATSPGTVILPELSNKTATRQVKPDMANSMTDPIPGVEPTKGGYYLWRYLPNKGAAVLFLLLFLASFFYISWKIYKTKARFCNVFAVGCFCMLFTLH